jgi:hypothetical protein
LSQNNRVMVMLTPEEIERLGVGNPKPEEPTREEKMSEYARSRERDEQGRFLSAKDKERAELEAYYYTPYKVVFKPKYNGPDHVLVRHEEMYWHQKAYVWAGITLGFIGIYGILIGVWEGFKALVFR